MDNSQLHERMHSQQQQHAGSMQQVRHPGLPITCCYQTGSSGSEGGAVLLSAQLPGLWPADPHGAGVCAGACGRARACKLPHATQRGFAGCAAAAALCRVTRAHLAQAVGRILLFPASGADTQLHYYYGWDVFLLSMTLNCSRGRNGHRPAQGQELQQEARGRGAWAFVETATSRFSRRRWLPPEIFLYSAVLSAWRWEAR
jgi:hypothetical protein